MSVTVIRVRDQATGREASIAHARYRDGEAPAHTGEYQREALTHGLGIAHDALKPEPEAPGWMVLLGCAEKWKAPMELADEALSPTRTGDPEAGVIVAWGLSDEAMSGE